jgi:hypothetical protein
LILALVAQQRTIDRARIEEAWADLQQLPTPWNRERTQTPSGGVIEFGGLDDEPEAASAPANVPEATPEVSLATSVDVEMAGPAEQLDHLEQMLADLDDEFHPVGSIRPEVELVFDDLASPFNESFEQEEVIADRYASTTRRRTEGASAPLQSSSKDDSLATQTVPMRWSTADFAPAGDEIVVEEEHDAVQESPEPRIVQVPRHQYRQLFARLRHG